MDDGGIVRFVKEIKSFRFVKSEQFQIRTALSSTRQESTFHEVDMQVKTAVGSKVLKRKDFNFSSLNTELMMVSNTQLSIT